MRRAKSPTLRTILSPLRLSLLVFILFPLLLLHSPLRTSPTTFLPPPLAPIHLPSRSSSPAPPASSWKQPALLTIHAAPLNISHVALTLLSTGVDTQSYRRVFTPIACLLNRSTAFPTVLIQPALVTCHIPRSLLRPNIHITLLLRNDFALRTALSGPQRNSGEVFELHDGDVVPLPEDPSIVFLHSHRLRSQLRREGGPGLAYIRSTVHWEPRLLDTVPDDKPRYELCLMTAMKQYPFLLPPWFEYYRRLGVDQVFVYDNDAPVDLGRMLSKWHGFAQVVYWPWPRSQMQSNNHFLLASKARCRFVAFFDADEFAMIGGPPGKLFMPGADSTDGEEHCARGEDETPILRDVPLLKRYVLFRASEGYHQISFRFLVMVNSGYVRRPKGDLPELYVHRAEVQEMSSGKVVIDTDREWMHHKIHIVKGKGHKMYWNMTLELAPESVSHNAMLVHYTRRSWEDFVAKNKVGGASVLTSGRPPKALDVEKPDAKYMNEAGIKFDGFRDRWREVMKIKDTGRLMLTWKTSQGEWRRASYCPKCRTIVRWEEALCTTAKTASKR